MNSIGSPPTCILHAAREYPPTEFHGNKNVPRLSGGHLAPDNSDEETCTRLCLCVCMYVHLYEYVRTSMYVNLYDAVHSEKTRRRGTPAYSRESPFNGEIELGPAPRATRPFLPLVVLPRDENTRAGLRSHGDKISAPADDSAIRLRASLAP